MSTTVNTPYGIPGELVENILNYVSLVEYKRMFTGMYRNAPHGLCDKLFEEQCNLNTFFADLLKPFPDLMNVMTTYHIALTGDYAKSYYERTSVSDDTPRDFFCHGHGFSILPFLLYTNKQGVEWDPFILKFSGIQGMCYMSGSIVVGDKELNIRLMWCETVPPDIHTLADVADAVEDPAFMYIVSTTGSWIRSKSKNKHNFIDMTYSALPPTTRESPTLSYNSLRAELTILSIKEDDTRNVAHLLKSYSLKAYIAGIRSVYNDKYKDSIMQNGVVPISDGSLQIPFRKLVDIHGVSSDIKQLLTILYDSMSTHYHPEDIFNSIQWPNHIFPVIEHLRPQWICKADWNQILYRVVNGKDLCIL